MDSIESHSKSTKWIYLSALFGILSFSLLRLYSVDYEVGIWTDDYTYLSGSELYNRLSAHFFSTLRSRGFLLVYQSIIAGIAGTTLNSSNLEHIIYTIFFGISAYLVFLIISKLRSIWHGLFLTALYLSFSPSWEIFFYNNAGLYSVSLCLYLASKLLVLESKKWFDPKFYCSILLSCIAFSMYEVTALYEVSIGFAALLVICFRKIVNSRNFIVNNNTEIKSFIYSIPAFLWILNMTLVPVLLSMKPIVIRDAEQKDLLQFLNILIKNIYSNVLPWLTKSKWDEFFRPIDSFSQDVFLNRPIIAVLSLAVFFMVFISFRKYLGLISSSLANDYPRKQIDRNLFWLIINIIFLSLLMAAWTETFGLNWIPRLSLYVSWSLVVITYTITETSILVIYYLTHKNINAELAFTFAKYKSFIITAIAAFVAIILQYFYIVPSISMLSYMSNSMSIAHSIDQLSSKTLDSYLRELGNEQLIKLPPKESDTYIDFVLSYPSTRKTWRFPKPNDFYPKRPQYFDKEDPNGDQRTLNINYLHLLSKLNDMQNPALINIPHTSSSMNIEFLSKSNSRTDFVPSATFDVIKCVRMQETDCQLTVKSLKIK